MGGRLGWGELKRKEAETREWKEMPASGCARDLKEEGKRGERPSEEQGGFSRTSHSQRLHDDFYFRRFCRRAPGFVAAGCRPSRRTFESSHCTSRWWSDLQSRFQRRRLRGPKRSMYDVCHSARSELLRDPASPPRSLPDPSQKEWQQAATLSSRLKRRPS